MAAERGRKSNGEPPVHRVRHREEQQPGYRRRPAWLKGRGWSWTSAAPGVPHVVRDEHGLLPGLARGHDGRLRDPGLQLIIG
jgi:hypothetical protein